MLKIHETKEIKLSEDPNFLNEIGHALRDPGLMLLYEKGHGLKIQKVAYVFQKTVEKESLSMWARAWSHS